MHHLSLIARSFFLAMLLASCCVDATRPLDAPHKDELGVTYERNSRTSSNSQEQDSVAYQEDIPRAGEFMMRGVYLKEKEDVPPEVRRLPPPPPVVTGLLPPCPAPPVPDQYLQSEDKEKKKDKKDKEKQELVSDPNCTPAT